MIGDTAGAAPVGMLAMPVPVTKVVKKTIPIYLEYSARTESIRNITLQAKVPGYILKQHVPDGTDVKEGDLLYTIDPRDLQAALDQAKAQVQRDTAALDYARSNLDRGTSARPKRLSRQGYVRPARPARCARPRRRWRWTRRLYARPSSISATRKSARHSAAGSAATRRRSARWINAGSTALNTLVQLDPIYVTFNPSETDLAEIQKARAIGKVEAEVFLPGRDASAHQRRTDLRRQHGRPLDRHDHGARDHRQRRS